MCELDPEALERATQEPVRAIHPAGAFAEVASIFDAAIKRERAKPVPRPAAEASGMNGYGFAGGHKIAQLAHMPLAHEATIIARVQSMRTRGGVVAEPLDFETSARWLHHFTHKARVTVPPPRAA